MIWRAIEPVRIAVRADEPVVAHCLSSARTPFMPSYGSMPASRGIAWGDACERTARATRSSEVIASQQSWTAGLVRDLKCTFDAGPNPFAGWSSSSDSPSISAGSIFILPTKNPGPQPGRCAKASGVQMLTTASMARTSSLTGARSMMWWCAAHEPRVDRPRSCGGAAPQGRNRRATRKRSNTRRSQSSPDATPSAWSRRVSVVVTVSVSRSPTRPITSFCIMPWRGSGAGLFRSIIAGACTRSWPSRRPLHARQSDRLIPGLDVLQFDRSWRGAAPAPPPLTGDDSLPVMLSLSSGTTGRPSGAFLSPSRALRAMDQPVGGNWLQRARSLPACHATVLRCRPLVRYCITATGGVVIFRPPPATAEELKAAANAHGATVVFWCRRKFADYSPSARRACSPCRACGCWSPAGCATAPHERAQIMSRLASGFELFSAQAKAGAFPC